MTTPLVLHSSRTRVTLQYLTPVVLLGLGATGLRDGFGLVPVVVVALGVITALVVLLDLPLRTEFTDEGIVRVCALRRHQLPWTRVVAVERAGGVPPRVRRGDRRPPPPAARGLTARTGPRRVHLLVDRRESHAEWEALHALLHDREAMLRAKEPPLDATPAGRGPRALHNRRQDR